ncbi:hypothetical protein LTR86_004300 [Recurvomyces mirabilis]|nr:hypothetical protein LTR86_004300 [Recurvomyces mirabilis]
MDSVARPGHLRRRTSSAAAQHRRPFWARNDTSFHIYIDNVRGKTQQSKMVDYGVDNFSYDQSYLEQWLMPEDLASRLPELLRDRTEDWEKAGAALCTTLERIETSYSRAMQAAYPSNPTRFASRASEQAVVGAEPTPIDSPVAPTPIFTIPAAQLENLTLTTSKIPTTHVKQEIGMESPPYTPFDSFGCATPITGPIAKLTATLPDLSRINTELSPLSMPDNTSISTAVLPGFDEVSWDYYTKHFAEEIRDCETAVARVRGFGRMIEVDLHEMARVMKPEVKMVFLEFKGWWVGMRPKVAGLEEKVEALEVPKLEFVTTEWEMVRSGQLGGDGVGVLDSI